MRLGDGIAIVPVFIRLSVGRFICARKIMLDSIDSIPSLMIPLDSFGLSFLLPSEPSSKRDVLSAQVVLYCHSLDVGLAKVHHLMEAQDVNGLAVRVSSASV